MSQPTNRLIALLHGNKPLLMGILNVTPDSFSDGGQYFAPAHAVARAVEMHRDGADIIDVGGESTRPGSEPVSADEQIDRIIPVIRALRQRLPAACAISVDTTWSKVAAAGLEAGADIINDVSAGRDDPDMFGLAARADTPIVLMHMQGTPKTMQDDPSYTSVVDEVLSFLMERIEAACAAGVPREHIVLDPGIGFGKRKQDNLLLLANLSRLVDLGFPVLLGSSRKRFMGAICRTENPRDLVAATAVTTAFGVMAGVRLFRIHDVRENRQAADVALAIKQAGEAGVSRLPGNSV